MPTQETFMLKNIPIFGDLVLAPMDGVTDLPFRLWTKSLGAAYTVSEFVNPRDILTYHPDNKRRLEFREIERPFGYQLYDDDPERIVRAAIYLQRYSPDFIDINLGCSARPVTHRGAGAALLKEPLKIAKIIRETTAAIPCPLTAKIRLGWDDTSRNYLEVSKIIEEEGASLITVHGRTKVQSYSGSADWNAIAEIKASRSIPIVGNGDVLRVIDIDKMKSHTRCDAVMIGRGALANPFIFMRKDIESFTIQALVDSLMHYVKEMIEYYDEIHGIQKSRKIIKRILLNYGIELETIKHFMELENFSELEERLKSLLILA